MIKFYTESKNIIKNMSSTIDDFTNFFKPEKEKKYFNLKDSIDESLSILRKLIKKEKIFIKTNYEDIKVLGINNELSHVIINLIQNSKDAFIYNHIEKRLISIITTKENNLAIIKFEDNAGGIKNEDFDKIFEPYFTTKHSSSGTGLGLFMSKIICEQAFNGIIEVKNSKNGVIFLIKIPLEENNE
jgi:C4-dicarboxylate-specific signal transduction histidine kinase